MNLVHDWIRLLPLGILGIASWSIWLWRRTMSHRAKPTHNSFRTSTSVVVPVFREDPEVLAQCLETWLAAKPDEVILVMDHSESECLDLLRSADLPASVQIITFDHTGKRAALGVGIRAARSEIIVVVDSDTAWTASLLQEIQMPFADPRVGGVGTRQTVAAPDTSIWRRLASWLLDTRFLDYVPAMGAKGGVPCLSGRTAAYRRTVVTPLLPNLEHEIFLGRECVAGDDGRMTWLVLGAGYKTVQQSSAHAVSMFPDSFWAFTKQRIRWSRNSYRCYLTAAWNGWLWKQPFITQLTVLQNLLTPLTMGISLTYLFLALDHVPAYSAALLVAWVFIGRGIRGLSHLREHPKDLLILPLVVVLVVFIALPIKLLAFLTMNRQGWLTRHVDQVGGLGQSGASLKESAITVTDQVVST